MFSPRRAQQKSTHLQHSMRKYPLSKYGKEHYLRRLNSRNITEREDAMFGESNSSPSEIGNFFQQFNQTHKNTTVGGIRIIIGRTNGGSIFLNQDGDDEFENTQADDEDEDYSSYSKRQQSKKDKKSKNFEVNTWVWDL